MSTTSEQPRGRRKTQAPCAGCGLHARLCLCADLPRLALKRTELVLLVHAKELKRTTNTGRLAVRALEGSRLVVRGEAATPVDFTFLQTDPRATFLLFPSDDAEDVEDAAARTTGPVRLLVPDGNWRQASKVRKRHPELADVRCVKLSRPNPFRHHLRRETDPNGRATLLAIAEALRAFEGDAVGEALLALYRLKLERTLEGRGLKIDGAL